MTTIDDLIRLAGIAIGCEGFGAGLTLIIPPDCRAVPGFPLGQVLTETSAGTHVRYPARHLVAWCAAHHDPADRTAAVFHEPLSLSLSMSMSSCL
ncbi:MAG: hypothetical protein JZU52_12575 [Lamprocystis purpurea]|jgi:hypothetical protein|uniref:hypothetical protein n=1 Tax=Lamprocystis purpurea TaxID=61598 RepID=UPI00037BDA05|nr:hypothetical protein [Lamprocystis purpurea]MBV5274430.1 hypothetical protein [Lamprocystis purpurea]